jgi:hypothetical protein
MTDEPRTSEEPSEPPPEAGQRRPLLERLTGPWNRLEPKTRARVRSVTVAVAKAALAVAITRALEADRKPAAFAFTPDLTAVDDIPDLAAEEQDDDPFGKPRSRRKKHDVGGYWRDQCLNPWLHASGQCRHEERWVADHTRGADDEPHMAA